MRVGWGGIDRGGVRAGGAGKRRATGAIDHRGGQRGPKYAGGGMWGSGQYHGNSSRLQV